MLLSMSDIANCKLNKEEKVTGEKRIEALFSKGKSFVAYPLRVVYLETDFSLPSSISILVSVPKKRIKSAVKRNRLKRLIREAYRLNKHYLNGVKKFESSHFDIAFVFVKDELTNYKTIEKGIKKGLMEIANKLSCNKIDENIKSS